MSAAGQLESQLEQRIAECAQLIVDAPTHAEKLAAFDVLRQLHGQRSPSRVRFMERVRGLAK